MSERRDPGLRAWITRYPDGHVGGVLLRRHEHLFDANPPSAYAASEDEVIERLELSLQEAIVADPGDLQRYLWTDDFAVRRTRVEVLAGDLLGKEPVVGRRTVSFSLPFAWSRLGTGAYRLLLPQFRWWTLVEELELAGAILSQVISGALMGVRTERLVDFAGVGDPRVHAWRPPLVQRVSARSQRLLHAPAGPPSLLQVAEDWVEGSARKQGRPIVGRDPSFELIFRQGRESRVAEVKAEATRSGAHLRDALEVVDARRRVAAAFDPERPRSVLLVGERGVGKTTFVRRLAKRFLQLRREKRPAPRIWASSSERILAGMTYLGMWQERCLSIAEALRDTGDYFYVGRLGDLLRDLPGGGQLSSILGPPAEAGEIALLAECTPAELVEAQRRAPRLVAHFQRLTIAEPRHEDLRDWVEAYARRRVRDEARAAEEPVPAGESEISFEGGALELLFDYSIRFRRDQAFPGKAMHFVDFLATRPRSDGGKGLRRIYPRDLGRLYAEYSGLPLSLVDDPAKEGAAGIARLLRQRVVGQDAACAEVARALTPFKAGLQPPEQPVASFLFVGPTGVGKTELAKQVAAQVFGDPTRLIRLDMSEYLGPGAARRLLEVGEGVRSLAELVRRQPIAVVLLDEIEKAHPAVFDTLLGVLGEGRLTDAAGRLVDFRMTTIVMTSNLGVSAKGPVGFDAKESASTHLEAVRRHFRPELFNRIDAVVPFRALEPADVLGIVDVLLAEVQRRPGLASRKLRVEVDAAARARLAELGYDRRFGARPLKRAIEERVVAPLATRLAADPALRERTLEIVGPELELRG